VKLCQKKKHYSRVFGLFPVAFLKLLLVKFGAKVKARNSKFKNEVIFEVFHQQESEKKKSKNCKFFSIWFSVCSQKYRKIIKDFNFISGE
jgi:hypothetical protein